MDDSYGYCDNLSEVREATNEHSNEHSRASIVDHLPLTSECRSTNGRNTQNRLSDSAIHSPTSSEGEIGTIGDGVDASIVEAFENIGKSSAQSPQKKQEREIFTLALREL